MSPPVRKLALATHLAFSVGWIGAVLAYLALGIAAVTQDAQSARGAWIAMEIIGWRVIVPLAIGTVLTGVVMALGTRWGLFRYYWVLLSFVLTTLATVVLLLHMPSVSSVARIARSSDAPGLEEMGGDLFHASAGLVVLLGILVLNVYKPPGLTRYGWRRQAVQGRADARAGRSDADLG